LPAGAVTLIGLDGATGFAAFAARFTVLRAPDGARGAAAFFTVVFFAGSFFGVAFATFFFATFLAIFEPPVCSSDDFTTMQERFVPTVSCLCKSTEMLAIGLTKTAYTGFRAQKLRQNQHF
jgi:hypothetical protein